MILLAALLCNYGRGKCLIIIGTEGRVPEAGGLGQEPNSDAAARVGYQPVALRDSRGIWR